jgi:hypothetical protein
MKASPEEREPYQLNRKGAPSGNHPGHHDIEETLRTCNLPYDRTCWREKRDVSVSAVRGLNPNGQFRSQGRHSRIHSSQRHRRRLVIDSGLLG